MNSEPSTPQNPTASVVIGFKDWGLERLELSIRSLRKAFGDIPFEIIVSDFGSVLMDPLESQRRIERLGARYIYSETDGTWSRSRALNAGFAVSKGQVLICTDADMLFSPDSLAPVVQRVKTTDRDVIVIQCRDLPSTHSHENVELDKVDWHELERVSRLRPRWGMGGMIAFSRQSYIEVRGLDERFEIYGGEDLDFAKRMKRAGRAVHWWDDRASRMYHIWHEPTRDLMAATEIGQRAIAFNREVHSSDLTVQRNLQSWQYPLPERGPLFSVVISTHNRAGFLAESMSSVLCQTVDDFELIIIDDGSTDHTRDVVKSFTDQRIRYFHQEQKGLAAARNFALDVSRGRFTVIHDDDDLMLPWRLDKHLSTIQPGSIGSYGGWIDFDDQTGEMTAHQGKELTQGSLLFTGGVYLHPTLMVRTDVLRRIRYTETFRSGSDYSLGVKLVRSGYRLNHTNSIHTLRRLHPGQITASQGVTQKASAVLSGFMARSPMGKTDLEDSRKYARELKKTWVPGTDEIFMNYGAFLPDHLVSRDVMLDQWVPDYRLASSLGRSSTTEFMSYRVTTLSGKQVVQGTVVNDCTWNDIAILRSLGPVSVSNPSRRYVNDQKQTDHNPISEGVPSLQTKITGAAARLSITKRSPYILTPSGICTDAVLELKLSLDDAFLIEFANPDSEPSTFTILTDLTDPVNTLDFGVTRNLLPRDSHIIVSSEKSGHALLQSAVKSNPGARA